MPGLAMRVPDRPATRIVFVAIGALGLAWAVAALGDDAEVGRLEQYRTAILQGETFDDFGVGNIADELRRRPDIAACATRNLEKIVPIRLRLVELALQEEDDPRADELAAELERDARKLLACSPYQPFAWLVLFWKSNLDGTLEPADFELLRMSLRTGPHEGWVARRRNQVALSVYAALPEDLKQSTIEEFRTLVRPAYLGEAAGAFVDLAPQTARDRIVERIAGLPAEDLAAFAERVKRRSRGKIELSGFELPAKNE